MALDGMPVVPLRGIILAVALVAGPPRDCPAVTYYVRQTVGDDAHDGTSPETAWLHVSRLSAAMKAGDTAYVGPGLYREQVVVTNDGTSGARIVFVADTSGQHTGDPPGVVMLTGADPVDESIFVAHSTPGVYQAVLPPVVAGVVEMDGAQYRYTRARDTSEHLVEKLTELAVVEKLPSSQFYDESAQTLYIHTSDGRPPAAHEIEIIRRGSGIGMSGRHYVTVMGFTFRHTGDAGISFFRGSGNGMAIDNTSYGSRQGIRVYGATDIVVYGNTLFRNDNSGVYFAAEATGGVAIGNIAYENVKGIRWSSQSVPPLAVGNTVFDNREAGIAVEEVDHVIIRHNILANNARYQLLALRTDYSSENNCFERGSPEQLTADFVFTEHFKTLGDYQRAKHQDLHSRERDCGPLPEKVDVHRLHVETTEYAERARKRLREGAGRSPEEAQSDERGAGWLERLFGR